MTLPAPAKLNLFLYITGRRDDGFHNLQTLFQLLDYGDTLELSRRDDGQLRLKSGLVDVPDEANLVMRAARELQSVTGTSFGADMSLVKRVPMGAGLGGGSSDCATALAGLNRLWGTCLDEQQLAAIGLKLGSDVPVFIRGHSAFAEGRGEVLQAVDLPCRWYLVIYPKLPVSTAKIFAHPDLTRDTPQRKIAALSTGVTGNDCQAVVELLYPEIAAARQWLEHYAPASLSGTGSSVFAPFDERPDAQRALDALPERWEAFIARGVNRSPLLDALEAG